MLEFDANIARAERHELRKSLRCVRVGDAFDELVHRAYSVRPDVRARVVENHVQHEVKQGIGEMHADLAACACYGVYDLDCRCKKKI